MSTIELDKISSVTKNLRLSHSENLTDQLSTKQGTVLAAQVLHDKSVYNEMELPTGRMSKLKKDDIIAVALGQRMALKGFVGHLPKTLKVNDVIHLLNFGGVAGICTSSNVSEVGEPLRIRVLGGIERNGKLLNIDQATLFRPASRLRGNIPLIMITAGSMDSGKTTVAAEVIKTLTRIGMRLAAAKLTGVGAMRDLYKMEDYGVYETVSFVDGGLSSTANIAPETVLKLGKGALNHLSRKRPDAIIVELGDGIIGKYGVLGILKDPEVQKNVRLHIACARDPAGAIKLVEDCSRLGMPVDVVSGPITDNEVGKAIISENLDVITYNAFTPSNEWLDLVIQRWAA